MKSVSPALAAVLTFVWPGAGHAYLGRRRKAVVFAVPLLLAALAIVLTIIGGIDRLLVYAITPSGAFTIFVLILVTGLWRLLALGDSTALARRTAGGLGRRGMVATAIVAILMVAMHGVLGYVAYATYDASSRIFVAGGPDSLTPSHAIGSVAASSAQPGSDAPADDEYLATPQITPAPKARVTILLTGIDSAETRTTSLTDTILVVSIDPNDGSVAMLSVPRDISEFPLYNGKTYTGKINSLMTWARTHKADFPDGPLPTLMNEVGFLIGVPINYYAAVDLAGFRRLVDAVGGVTVVNDRAIDDPRYEWLDGTFGFSLPAGKVTLNGRNALAFVRSRQGIGDSDFTRAARQQQLLLAIRSKLMTPQMLPKIPSILQIAGDTVRTNVPTDRLEEFMAIARSLDENSITRVVLGPPYSYHPPTEQTGGTYILRLKMDKLKALSVKIFGADSRYAKG